MHQEAVAVIVRDNISHVLNVIQAPEFALQGFKIQYPAFYSEISVEIVHQNPEKVSAL